MGRSTLESRDSKQAAGNRGFAMVVLFSNLDLPQPPVAFDLLVDPSHDSGSSGSTSSAGDGHIVKSSAGEGAQQLP